MYIGISTLSIFMYWFIYADTGDGHSLITYK